MNDELRAKLNAALVAGYEGDLIASLGQLRELVAQNPDVIEIRYNLAMTQLLLGMFDEGCANLKQILAVDPTHEEALRQSAYC